MARTAMDDPERARRRPPIPLNAIRAFEAAARHESFVGAAQELHVTAAAVSRHVKLLEGIVRQKLFERRPQSLVLTKFGRAWLPALTDAFNIIDSSAARALQPERTETVTISVQTAFAVGWLLPRLASFYRRMPTVALRIYTHTETPDLVLEKRYDGMIVSGRGIWDDYDAHFLIPNRLVPVCSPGYLRAKILARPTELLGETLIVAESNPEDWRDWFASVGLKHVGIVRPVLFPTGFLPVHAALCGLGISLADRSLIQEELDSGRLVMPLDTIPMTRGTGWYFAHVPGRRVDRTFQDWVAWLKREANAYLDQDTAGEGSQGSRSPQK